LQANAPARHDDEGGCAPTTCQPAAHNTITVLTPYDESRFGQFRDKRRCTLRPGATMTELA
jgi:hypothetical protein